MVEKDQKAESYKYALFIIAGSILVAVILVALIVRPMWNNLVATNKQLKLKRDDLSKLETKLENLKKLKEKEKELIEKNAKVLAALPEDKDVARLFLEFEGIANQSGLSVTRVVEATSQNSQSNTVATSSLVKPISYGINAKSPGYGPLKSALGKFEQALRILSISTVDIRTMEGNLDINFSVNTYTRGEE